MSARGIPSKEEWIRTAMEQYEGPLLRYAMRITRELEKSRDVVQDTFLKLCSEDPVKLDPYLSQWLFTVCRNRALDVQRKDGRMQPLTEFQMDTTEIDDPSPSHQAERSDLFQKAMNCMEKLPANQQEVLRLKFQNGLSYKEISAVTQLSVSNVGFLVHTALKNLRGHLPKELKDSILP